MKKRTLATILLLFCAAGIALGQAVSEKGKARQEAYTQEDTGLSQDLLAQFKHPTSWLKLGFDQRNREVYANNFIGLDKHATGHEWHFQRMRSRFSAVFTPAEDLTINTRLVWEWRNWCEPDSRSGPIEWDEVLFDRLNVSMGHFLGMPATLTVGRQDLIFGNGWLVLDGTPLDGSRTIYFDAARLTYNEDDINKLDVVYIEQPSATDQWLSPFNDQERAVTEQDERGTILYFTHKADKMTQIDGYYIWKHDHLPGKPGADNYPSIWSNKSDIHAVGARLVKQFDEHWKARGEFAQEMGRQNGHSLCAFGFNSRLDYMLNDAWKNDFNISYEYLSGDDPGTGTDEGFDPLWARWPQWSELYIYTYATETRIAETTNLHRIQFGWNIDPTEKIHFCNEYNLLFADQNPEGARFSKSGDFRGQLLATKLIYKFTPYISGHLWGEYFFPGNFYSKSNNDSAVFLRYELMITF